jgi:dGTP triphosphohydrolase
MNTKNNTMRFDHRLRSELQISNIETNKQFCRLSEKTQVAFPGQGRSEVVRNRLTHSYEVATSSAIMAYNIAIINGWDESVVDYQGSVRPCSLLHDIGHPPLGHDGAKYLDTYFKKNGLSEGFCDNNNTLTIIEKNHIMVSKHTICSVIKYPDRLYRDQDERYSDLLKSAVKEDAKYFAPWIELAPQTRTVACQIMDEADRNTYICSDLSDFLCLGNTISIDSLKSMAHQADLSYRYSELNTLISMLRSGDKTAIKAYFNTLKNQFNMNYTLSAQGLCVINPELQAYREFLWDVEMKHYIEPIRKKPFHLENMKKLEEYVDKVVVQGFAPSRTYAEKIEQADNAADVLRAQRDMIAETTDWYVTHIHKNALSAGSAPRNSHVVKGGLDMQPGGMAKDC